MRKNLLFIMLGLIVLARLLLIWTKPAVYGSDEIIVTTISRQSLSQLLVTIQSEPHPPGFYLLLSLLPVSQITITKTILIGINTLLLSIAIFYAHKKRLIQKYKLQTGLILFFCSFSFISISSEVKQDIISFPLTILGLTLAIDWASSNRFSQWKVLMMHLLLIATLSFGYINGLILAVVLLVLSIIKRDRFSLVLWLFQAIIWFGYELTLGWTQIVYNQGRFGWTETIRPSLLITTTMHFGTPVFAWLTDLAFFIFFSLLIWFVLTQFKTLVQYQKGVLLAVVPLGGFHFLTNTVVQTRYMVFFFLLLSIIVGWSLDRTKQQLKLSVIGLFFLLGVYGLNLRLDECLDMFQDLQFLNEYTAQKTKDRVSPTGILYANDYSTVYLPRLLGSPGNAVPVNITYPLYRPDPQTITREELAMKKTLANIDKPQVIHLFKQTQLTSFIYIYNERQILQTKKVYDPQNIVLAALQEQCLDRDIEYVIEKHTLMLFFDDCSF